MADAIFPERRHEGMVRAEHVGRQVRNQPPNLAQLLLMMCSRWRLWVKPSEVLLDRFQARLGHVQTLGDPATG